MTDYDQKREHPRVELILKITYKKKEGFMADYAENASEGGLFMGGGVKLLGVQSLGIAAIIAWTVLTMTIVFGAVKAIVGLRVSPEEELRGLDIGEHGQESYAGFSVFVTT